MLDPCGHLKYEQCQRLRFFGVVEVEAYHARSLVRRAPPALADAVRGVAAVVLVASVLDAAIPGDVGRPIQGNAIAVATPVAPEGAAARGTVGAAVFVIVALAHLGDVSRSNSHVSRASNADALEHTKRHTRKKGGNKSSGPPLNKEERWLSLMPPQGSSTARRDKPPNGQQLLDACRQIVNRGHFTCHPHVKRAEQLKVEEQTTGSAARDRRKKRWLDNAVRRQVGGGQRRGQPSDQYEPRWNKEPSQLPTDPLLAVQCPSGLRHPRIDTRSH